MENEALCHLSKDAQEKAAGMVEAEVPFGLPRVRFSFLNGLGKARTLT
jgi:hypothetical protein